MHLKPLLAYCSLLFFTQTLFAQNDLKEGYIITNDSDTIYGYIDNLKNLLSAKICYFNTEPEGETTVYSPKEIQGYAFVGGNIYKSKRIDSLTNDKYYFAEFLVDGVVDLYFIKEPNHEKFYIEKDNQLVELSNDEVQYMSEGKVFKKESHKYIGVLSYLMADANGVSEQIKATSFDHSSMIKLTTAYHNEICADEACTVYYKKGSLSKQVKWHRYIGVSAGVSISEYKLKSEFTYGEGVVSIYESNANITETGYGVNFPGISFGFNKNGRLTIQSGVLLQSIFYSKINLYRINLPTTLEFDILSHKKVIPYISAGVLVSFNKYTVKDDFYVGFKGTDLNDSDIQLNDALFNPSITSGISLGIGLKINCKNGNYFKVQISNSNAVDYSNDDEDKYTLYRNSTIKLKEFNLNLIYPFYIF